MSIKTIILLLAVVLPSPVYAWDYMIGEGDTLTVSVWGEKDLSLSAKVRPDGKITLPAVGEVTAANTTTKDLQDVLTGKLKGIVKNPIVTVMVTDMTNNKAYVFGGGVKSGVFMLTQRTTLLQLLCQIEDAKKADLKRAYVLRSGKKIKEDFFNLFINGNAAEDITIEPNDVIFIPVNVEKNVYVMGAVITPKFIEYREGLTVMEAILEAGGFTKYASQNATIIYRKEGDKQVSLPVKIKKLTNGDLSQNAKLRPGDYVVVEEGIF
jgi:polysaccharide export outer membrane protein